MTWVWKWDVVVQWNLNPNIWHNNKPLYLSLSPSLHPNPPLTLSDSVPPLCRWPLAWAKEEKRRREEGLKKPRPFLPGPCVCICVPALHTHSHTHTQSIYYISCSDMNTSTYLYHLYMALLEPLFSCVFSPPLSFYIFLLFFPLSLPPSYLLLSLFPCPLPVSPSSPPPVLPVSTALLPNPKCFLTCEFHANEQFRPIIQYSSLEN